MCDMNDPKCPVCGYEFSDEESYDLITYWGEGEAVDTECPSCDAKLSIREKVKRTWSVDLREPKAFPKGS